MDNNVTQSLQRLLDCFLTDYADTDYKKVSSEELENLDQILESIFFFSFIWSVGSTVDYDGRKKFD